MGRQDDLVARFLVHRFEADTGGDAYGNELDGLITWKASWKQSISFKFAIFNGKDGFEDKSQVWLFTSYKFGKG